MTVTHTYRSQAVDYAEQQGYTGFRTVYDPETGWKATYQDKEPSPAHSWAADKEWVSHTEVFWEDGRKVGVMVVMITLDELVEMGVGVWVDDNGVNKIGDHVIEPLTLDLWDPDPVQGEPVPEEKRRVRVAAAPRAPRDSPDRSTATSPVKLVWDICAANPGKSRSEVVNLCVSAGVNKSTAGTQYSHWKKKRDAG